MKFSDYIPQTFYDELFHEKGRARAGAKLLIDKIESLPENDLQRKQTSAETALLQMGNTFNVYGSEEGAEKILPFDIIPRIIEKSEWLTIEKGLQQRIHALNLFIDDIYHDKKIIKDKVIPNELIMSCSAFRKQLEGFTPPKKNLVPHHGNRLDPGCGRQILCSRRQFKMPFRGFLCA